MCEHCGCTLNAEREGGNVSHAHGAQQGHHPHHAHHAHQKHGALDRHPEAEPVLRALLADNDAAAAHNRSHLDAHGVRCINLMSSPGAGKTRLLEATIRALKGRYRIGVIEGDLETENDAERIRSCGVPAIQITTGSACHLDANMVHAGLHELDLERLDLLFIENVGNLVCPASFDLGQHRNVVLLSVPEGDDKPAKYPVMFRAADLVLITKTDLLAHIDSFSVERAEQHLRKLAVAAPLLELAADSATTLAPWLGWLVEQATPAATSVAHVHA